MLPTAEAQNLNHWAPGKSQKLRLKKKRPKPACVSGEMRCIALGWVISLFLRDRKKLLEDPV